MPHVPGLNEPVTLVGHPFATIGVGEQLRSHVAALDVVRVELRVADVFGHAARTDVAHTSLVAGREVGTLAAGTRIFHINADEVPAALERLDKQFGEGRNIIVPAWELPRFPRAWVPALRRFDAVWALSRFIQDGLSAVGVASTWVGQSVEPVGGFAQPLPPRRAYGIRESAFVLLTMLDLTSRAERKNPRAVLELMRRLRAVRPLADVQLVLKAKAGEADAAAWVAELGELPPEQVHVIATPLDATATRGLIAACDMFVSLHRAEGFGRGLGEAMALGRGGDGHGMVRQPGFHDGGDGAAGAASTDARAGGRLSARERTVLGGTGCGARAGAAAAAAGRSVPRARRGRRAGRSRR